MTQQRKIDYRACAYVLTAAAVWLITYRMTLKQATVSFNSDVVLHMKHAVSLDHVLAITHNGWHFICWLFHALLPMDIYHAAAASTAAFNALTGILVLVMIDRIVKIKYDSLLPAVQSSAVAVMALMVGPLYMRFYNERYYLGQGTPNTWHNPTTTGVRPFLLLVTILTVDYFSDQDSRTICVGGKNINRTLFYQIVLGILLAFGTLIKPSLPMVYLPACFILAVASLIKERGKNFFTLLVRYLYILPAILIMGWQYLSIFLGGNPRSASGPGFAIDFFYTARLFASSVVLSLIMRMAFPFLIIVLWRKEIFKDKMFRLIGLEYLAGLLITWTFRETGRRINHGNFGWGNVIACSALWIFCLCFFYRKTAENREKLKEKGSLGLKCRFFIPLLLLAWHLIAGCCYYGNVLHDMGHQL